DFRLLTADKAHRAAIDSEIETLSENLSDEDEDAAENGDGEDPRISKERAKREYENFSWNNFADGAIGSAAAQPSQVEFIPPKHELAVPASEERWKARAGAIAIRADEEGLYKVVAGKRTQIRSGYYDGPVITPNGRWVIATRYEGDRGGQLVRINLLTNREFLVQSDELPAYRAIAFVTSIGRVLVGPMQEAYDYYDGKEDDVADDDGGGYSLLDPESGSLIAARGEVRPLVQQTF